MLNSTRRETHAVLLFACVLAALLSCAKNVSRMVDPGQDPTAAICHYSLLATLATPSLEPAESTQANVVVASLDGTPIEGQTLWASQNSAIATVSSTGVVTAVAVGETAIQVSLSRCADTASVTVEVPPSSGASAPEVATVAVMVDSTSLAVNDRAQAKAIAKDSIGNVIADQSVTWASLSPTIASISPTGLITGIVAGTTTVQATISGRVGSTSITVIAPPVQIPPPPPVAVVVVAIDSITLVAGRFAQASAFGRDAAGNVITGEPVSWSSLTPNVATVSASGVITAIGAGTAVIQATIDGCIGGASITVVAPPPQVATVAVALDSTTLTVGNLARASATAKDPAGAVIAGQAVTWSSLAPGVAAVSPSGVVTALALGSAVIQATVSGKTGAATLTVVAPPTPIVTPPTIVSSDFNDGTLGSLVDPWGVGIDFPVDPTNSGRGKVARILYAPAQATAQSSEEKGFGYKTSTDHVRYGRTIWFRGDVYLPSSGSTIKANENRKLLDFLGTGPSGSHAGMVLHRRGMMLYLSAMDWMNGSLQETVFDSTGIRLNDDTWYTIEVKMTTNSADKVRDGVLEVYMNGATTPTYSRTTGLGWITEAYPGGSYFSWFGVGYQLTVDAGETVFSEYRYWDNVAFTTTRGGR